MSVSLRAPFVGSFRTLSLSVLNRLGAKLTADYPPRQPVSATRLSDVPSGQTARRVGALARPDRHLPKPNGDDFRPEQPPFGRQSLAVWRCGPVGRRQEKG
jgi:hypothetical protein